MFTYRFNFIFPIIIYFEYIVLNNTTHFDELFFFIFRVRRTLVAGDFNLLILFVNFYCNAVIWFIKMFQVFFEKCYEYFGIFTFNYRLESWTDIINKSLLSPLKTLHNLIPSLMFTYDIQGVL